jgi:hypothetical protein
MTFDPNEVLRRFHMALVREIQANNAELLRSPFSVAEIYQNLVPYRTHRDEIGVQMNADYEHALLRLLAGENDYLTIESRTARQEIREELESPNPNTALYRDFAAADVRLNPEKIDEALAWDPRVPDATGEDSSEGDAWAREEIGTEEPDGLAPDLSASAEGAVEGSASEDEAEGMLSEVDPHEGEEESVEEVRVTDSPDQEVVTHLVGEVDSEEVPVELSGQEDQWPSELGEEEGDEPSGPSPDEEAAASSPATCAWCREALPRRPGVNFCPYCGCSVHLAPCPECGEELELKWRFCVACGTEVSS